MRSRSLSWNRWSAVVLALLVLLFAFTAKIDSHSVDTGWRSSSHAVTHWLEHQKMEYQPLASPVCILCTAFFLLAVSRPLVRLGRRSPLVVRSFRAELFELRRFLRPPPVLRFGF